MGSASIGHPSRAQAQFGGKTLILAIESPALITALVIMLRHEIRQSLFKEDSSHGQSQGV